MKYKRLNFCQLHNKAIEILNSAKPKIPYSARWLYIQLNFLEHRYTGHKEDFFFRSIKDLQKDTGMGTKQIVQDIKLLNNLKLIHTWQMHWLDKETKKENRKTRHSL